MRTSLNNIRQAEKYLSGQLKPEDSLVFKARLLTSPLLRLDVHFQQQAYRFIHLFHRKKLKQEVESVHDQLFSNPAKEAFRQQIFHIFNQQ